MDKSSSSLSRDIQEFYSKKRIHRNYEGTIFTLDLDKTYLDTEFEQFKKLVKIPFESANQKKNVPGAAPLVKELSNQDAPIFFISGSPKGMRKVIEKKLALDGIKFNGLLLKDYGVALKKLNIRQIIDKIGYKLAALLYGRITFPLKTNEILFGDDSEYDAAIYSLYSDIISGRLKDFQILTILERWGVNDNELGLIHEYLNQLNRIRKKHKFTVEQIFIHLETKTSPQDYIILSDKVTPTYNYFQTAVMLYQNKYINRNGLFRVILHLIKQHKFNLSKFISSMQDLLYRGLIEKRESKKLLTAISKGNPLTLSLKILNELKTESSRILENFTKKPIMLARKPLALLDIFQSEDKCKLQNEKEEDILMNYLFHSPKRHV